MGGWEYAGSSSAGSLGGDIESIRSKAAVMRFQSFDISRLLGTAVFLTLILAACAGQTYQVSGIGAVGVYGTVTDFLAQRGYEILPEPTLGPVVVMERTNNGQVDRLSVFEQHRQSSDAGGGVTTSWFTVLLELETYELDPDGRRRQVAPSAVARAHADSLLTLLRANGSP